jgi:hypothetical protein
MNFSKEFVKTWIERDFNISKTATYKNAIERCFDRCFGALQFALCILPDKEEEELREKNELREWWNEEMRPTILKELEERKISNELERKN